MYSLSTCWNSHRHIDGREMLREIADLGFQYAELSHGIRISLLPGALDAVDAGEIKISSLHNFCPLPVGINYAAPNVFKFTADSARERENAYRHTVKTIETAARLKAPVVVLHLGSIEMKEFTEKLIDLTARGERHTTKYLKLCQQLEEKRHLKKEHALALAYEMLGRLVPVAEQHGVRLGIENREALEEIPLEGDYDALFQKFPAPTVGYWHDTGHAQIKENLGFIDHVNHLAARAERLLGFHLHDVQSPARDHCPPGAGGVRWADLKPLVQPAHIKVFELSPAVPVEELRRGVVHLKSIWGEP
jgi:sugar phosphate isomerase/epimerase